MRERMRSSTFDERRPSWQRSRSRSSMNDFVDAHSVDVSFDKQGSYTKSYNRRSPSPIKSDEAAYLFGRSPSPPTILRLGDYYKTGNVASTLTPIHHVKRSYREIENENSMAIHKQLPVRGLSRESDYEYYPELYNRRADENRKISERRLGNSRYEHDAVDKEKDRVVETKRLSRYNHHIVERGSEDRRAENNQVNHGDPSPSSVRKYEDLGDYNSVSNSHPVRPYFHPSRNQNISGNMWDSDCYDSVTNGYGNEPIGHFQKPKEFTDEGNFCKQDFERDPATFRTKKAKRLFPSKCGSIMSKNIEANSEKRLKNIDDAWVNEKPTQMYFQEQDTIDNISLSLSRAYVPQRIDFGVSYIHGRAIKEDVKKRLGGRASVKTRLGPLQNVKQRLGPIPVVIKQPSIRPTTAILSDDGRAEPPEDSESFRYMTHYAYLKFSKFLNENRRKFMENGSLSCTVCNSSEFVGARSLAQHSYQSCKSGMRSEHLGFHKALCVLMGWKTAEGVNGPWTVKKLPGPDAEKVQNDLLIWPPVVLIHGKAGVNANEVRDFLQGKGIGECLGSLSERKGPSGALIVAGFKGTLPGYVEAAKLDSDFAKDGHGRANLGPLTGENSLYGYLGVGRDLDKLNCEMRKKCILKSRRDVQSYAG